MRNEINQKWEQLKRLLAITGATMIIFVVASISIGVSPTSTSINFVVAYVIDTIGLCVLSRRVVKVCNEIERLDKNNPLPEPLDKAIASNHGNDLAIIMEAIRNEPLEYLAYFDNDGNKITEGTCLSPCECNIPRRDIALRHAADTMVHNHPGLDQVSFSSNDIYRQLSDCIKTSVVVTHDFNYIMENPYWNRDDSPDPQKVKEYMDELLSAYSKWKKLFWRRYVRHVSYCVARYFGLVYRIEDLRVQRLKTKLASIFTVPRRVINVGLTSMAIIAVVLMAVPTTGSEELVRVQCLDALDEDVQWSREVKKTMANLETKPTERQDYYYQELRRLEDELSADDYALVVRNSSRATGIYQPEKPVLVDAID